MSFVECQTDYIIMLGIYTWAQDLTALYRYIHATGSCYSGTLDSNRVGVRLAVCSMACYSLHLAVQLQETCKKYVGMAIRHPNLVWVLLRDLCPYMFHIYNFLILSPFISIITLVTRNAGTHTVTDFIYIYRKV